MLERPSVHKRTITDIRTLIACPDCDYLMIRVSPGKGQKVVCPRCGHTLLRNCDNSLARSLAISLTGLLLYFPAILLPLLTFRILGMSESGNILQTVHTFLQREYFLIAIAVFLFTVLFPIVKLGSLAVTALALILNKPFKGIGRLFKISCHLEEWAMVEVFLLGILITIIKMYDMATIHFNTGFYCFCGLVICTVLSCLVTCRENFWFRIDQNKQKTGGQNPGADNTVHPARIIVLDETKKTAAEYGLARCRACGKLAQLRKGNTGEHCPRCGEKLHLRAPRSVSSTWALIITAALLLLPANLLPIMNVDFFGAPTRSTIFDGILLFFDEGSYAIALIILTASILIPIFKIVGLSINLLTIHFRRARFLQQKTRMFRFITFIGRWSMLDIFVVALLGSFIHFGFITTIEAAPAALFFCTAVITTMLAAGTFDPRVMWDVLSEQKSL